MEKYSGKAKCSCGKRAKWKCHTFNVIYFACNEHKDRLSDKVDFPHDDEGPRTEADYSTWGRL